MRVSILQSMSIILIGWVYYQYLVLIGVQTNITDFTVFYSSSEALLFNSNPYSSYITLSHGIPNLNPPATIVLFNPITWMRYDIGIFAWSLLSLLLGILASLKSCKILLDERQYQQNRLNIILVFLMVTPALINFIAAQVAGMLFFLIIYGYWYFLNNRQTRAGVLWGMAMAVKLFPGLILFYAINQKKHKTAMIMVITFVILWLLPLVLYGPEIYHQYFQSLSFAQKNYSNWNVSIYAYINRIFMITGFLSQKLSITIVYVGLFVLFFISYLLKLNALKNDKEGHRGFCLTIVLMLILAPVVLGYYFILLLFPMVFVWQACVKTGNRNTFYIWSLAFVILNFATRYRLWATSMFQAFTYHSFYFYGALILVYLLANDEVYQPCSSPKKIPTRMILIPVFIGEFLLFNLDLLNGMGRFLGIHG